MTRRRLHPLLTLLLILLAIIFLLPILLVVLNSFKSRLYISAAPFAPPTAETFVGFDNYLTGLRSAGFAAAFGRSVFITVGSVLLLVVGCSMTAWYLARAKGWLPKALYLLFVFSMIVPFQMVMYTLTYVVGQVGLDTVVGILPVYLGFGAGLTVFILSGFARAIPRELEEAAIMDGANQWIILWRVYVPTSTAALATVGLYSTVYHWNEWFNGILYMKLPEQYPLQSYLRSVVIDMKLTNMGAQDWQALALVSDKTVKCAQIFLAALPILLVYPFLQKYFVKGMVLGSVKG